jgi:signal transduction histidine kinase/ActR/RegA family two-component response regulator
VAERAGEPGDDRDRRIAELEARLRRAERHLEETQQLAAVGNWEWSIDEEGASHPSWSRQMQRIFGRDPDGPPPTLEDLIAAIHPDDRPGFEALIKRIRSSQGPFRHGYRIVDTAGEVRHLRTRWDVERGEGASSRRTYGVTQDISELKRSQAQLRRAQRLEAVGHLASGVAHDFNNLLSVILNNAECLAEAVDGDASVRVDEIERAARTAAELIGRLLLFSGRDVAGSQLVDLGAAVREAEPLLRRAVGDHIELMVDARGDLPPVRLAAGELEQILVNLVVNARDALPEGGTIAVAVARSPAVPILMLRVADDGVGMGEEVAEQAFDPFFTTKPRGHGTGLGLAAVYGIVGRAGGHVEIESEPGGGTEVTAYLPIAEEGPAEDEPSASQAPAAGGDDRTVMVVDNDEAVREVIAHMLEKRGYRTRLAGSAAEAETIAVGPEVEIDVLLTDVVMPGASGWDLVMRLRQRGIDLPAIFMTGHAREQPRDPADGRAIILQKPFGRDELLRALGDALGEAETGR